MAISKISVKGLRGQFDTITLQGDSSIVYNESLPYGTALAGAPVKLTGDRTVGLCVNNDVPYGTLIHVEADGAVSVGRGGVQAFRNPDNLTIGSGGGSIAAGVPIVAAADSKIKAGADGSGIGSVLAIESDYGVSMIYVDMDRKQVDFTGGGGGG